MLKIFGFLSVLLAICYTASAGIIFTKNDYLSFLNFSQLETNPDVFYEDKDLTCGPNTEKCYWHICLGQVCICKDGYSENPDTKKCEECDCGFYSFGCSLLRGGGKKCTCIKDYQQKDEECKLLCKSNADCQHGGICRNQLCDCRKGLSGFECDEVDACQAELKNCKSPGGVCSFDDKKGKAVCQCNENYLFEPFSNSCKACHCEKEATCAMEFDKIICKCKPGYSKKPDTGLCERCNCGSHGVSCQFLPSGQTRCSCKPGYADNQGICSKCDCGGGASCTFDGGSKVCDCLPGFSKNPVTGLCQECVCGDGEIQCFFEGSTQRCICESGFVEQDGKCQRCDCGEGATKCFVDQSGNKRCVCKDGYAESQGVCLKCDCGVHGLKCLYEGSKKRCYCSQGYTENEGTCKECDCGKGALACTYDGTQKRCFCASGYVEKDGKCQPT